MTFINEAATLTQLEAEAIGWISLEEGAYLHLGDPLALVRGEESVIETTPNIASRMTGKRKGGSKNKRTPTLFS